MTFKGLEAKATADLRVVAVVVSYNRETLLQQSLDALQAQTRPLDAVLVIDNASTDKSEKVAKEHSLKAEVVVLTRNTGGAGGFAAGIAYATETLDADCVWLMDDDTIPEPAALQELLKCADDYPGEVALVGSRVVWHDGREHPMNTPRVRPGASQSEMISAGMVQATPVRSSSFVSMLIAVPAVREQGLPVSDYFIWNDDFEYSLRLLKKDVGLASHASQVLHLTKNFGSTDADPGERFFYEVRNKVWLLRFSSGLTPFERLLYTGSSLRRWFRTVRFSQNKKLLLEVGWRGLRRGFGTRPLDNTAVLAGLGTVSENISSIEGSLSNS